MSNNKSVQMINSLNKWRNILQIIGDKSEVEIVDDILKIIEEDDIKVTEEVSLKKESDADKLIAVLKGIKEKDRGIIDKYKLKVVSTESNIESKWEKISDNQKTKLVKLELNIIYALLYNPIEVKYRNNTKKELIADIDYFIDERKRNQSIDNSI